MTPLEKLKKLAKRYKFEDLMAIEHIQSGYDARLSGRGLQGFRDFFKGEKL